DARRGHEPARRQDVRGRGAGRVGVRRVQGARRARAGRGGVHGERRRGRRHADRDAGRRVRRALTGGRGPRGRADGRPAPEGRKARFVDDNSQANHPDDARSARLQTRCGGTLVMDINSVPECAGATGHGRPPQHSVVRRSVMKSSIVRSAGVASVVTLALGLSACSSSDEGSGSGSDASGEPTTIQLWTWAAGFDKAAEAFNAAHDDVQVEYTQIEAGNKGGYDKIRNSVAAGNAPCLAQVGYETLPSFVSEGNVVDVTEFAAPDEDAYTPAGWAGVTVGDKIYGAPQDQG